MIRRQPSTSPRLSLPRNLRSLSGARPAFGGWPPGLRSAAGWSARLQRSRITTIAIPALPGWADVWQTALRAFDMLPVGVPALKDDQDCCLRGGSRYTSCPQMGAEHLPCGYVTGVHEALVAGIPGLKGESC